MTQHKRITLIAAIVALPVFAGVQGCTQRNLFTDNKSPSSLKYFEDDSAVQTRETRNANKSAFGGFGYPTGPSSQ